MSYFQEISNYASYLGTDADFHFMYNANSGGGQAFLGGKYIDANGELVSPESLNGKTSVFKIKYVDGAGIAKEVILNDPKAKYDIKPRGNGSTSMKLGIGNNREAPSRIISSFFMLPPTCGVKMPINLDLSILSSSNYWLLSMWLECNTSVGIDNEIQLIPKDYVFCGGINKDSNTGAGRYFSLNSNNRILDIIHLANTADPLLPEMFRSNVQLFADIYRGNREYSYDECSQAVKELMVQLAASYPEKFSGISDPLPCLLELALEQKNSDTHAQLSPSELESIRKPGGTNTLLYGVPGSGKSWTIEHEYCPAGSHVERLVFHPDYTSSDFIGQILPVVDKENDNQVTYEFTPGPFTTILRDAYANPSQEHILIVEELNRGNAPAIFGDIFQLLDRTVAEKTVDGIKYPAGTSEYEITNKNLAQEVYKSSSHKIRIPSNLSILATMNTSDQNVFTLDTAFQRRWKMRLIENSFENVRSSLTDCQILDTGVTWSRFCKVINRQIVGNKAKMASSEDKRLGVYFVHESDLTHNTADEPVGHDTIRAELHVLLKAEMEGNITDDQKTRLQAIRDALKQNRIFPEKVIKYLWDDAFKFNPEAIFDTKDNKELDSLEAVIRMFVYENRGRARFNIFNDTIRTLLYEP